MDFFEKLGDTISAKGKEVADKARDTAEILSLKSQISTCEEVIKKNYLEIGRLFYEQYGENPDAPFEKQRNAIKNARVGATELRDKINQLKGL
ncbi:MAG: hypothetical protein J1E03_11965 [Acetatifactor sp.]|nr:hypothetical protein [Acetatifactor sp.]